MDKFPPLQIRLLIIAIAGIAVVAPVARAQTPPPDYARGFELLRRAGLPDVKDWKYVHFETQYRHGQEMIALEKKPAGNAWMEPQPLQGNGKLRRILLDGSNLMAVSEGGDGNDYSVGMIAAQAAGLQFAPGKIKDTNFASGDAKQSSEAADAAALAAQITKLASGGGNLQEMVQYRNQLLNLFFTAAHFHRRGFEKESAEIVSGLQKVLPRPELLIEASIDHLGDMRLSQAVARFRTDRDWKALQSSLESVMADFPELWQSRPLAERLLAQVKTRSAGQVPPPVPSGQFALTNEQQEWWKTLTEGSPAPKKEEANAGEPFMGMHMTHGADQWGNAWLARRLELPEESQQHWHGARSGGMTPFDASKDWDWITVLAAALGDSTLTMRFGADRYGRFGSSWMSFDPSQPPRELSESELENRWMQLGAPLTRDDLARAFLGAVLPLTDESGSGGSYAVSQMNQEDLREQAKTWSAKMTKLKGLDLARLYFKEGSEQHRRIVATMLARQGEERDMAALEESALAAPNNSLELAMVILQKRKAAGKPFFEKFKTRLIEENKQNSPGEEVPDYIKGQLQALEGLVSGKGMKDMFADYASGAMDDNALMTSLQSLDQGHEWKQEDVEAAFAAMAKVPSSEGKRRYMLLEVASRGLQSLLKLGEGQAPGETASGGNGDSGEKAPPEWAVKLLRDFIAQNKDVKVQGWMGIDIRLGQYGCFLLDALWNPPDMVKAQGLFQQLPPEDFWPYLESRGLARLEGKQPPAVPDPASVSEARKAEIKAAVEKIGDGGWVDFYTNLKLEEKISAIEALKGMEAKDSWKKPLLTVTDVQVDAEAAAASALKQESWMALKGRAFDGALGKQLLELCQQAYKEKDGKNLVGTVNFRTLHRGMSIALRPEQEEESRESEIGYWLSDSRSEDVTPETTAMAFVRWRDRGGESAVMMALRGQDGAWKLHTGEEPPAGFEELPFPPTLSAEDFEKELGAFLSEWSPAVQDWNVDFGVFKIPAKPAEEEK